MREVAEPIELRAVAARDADIMARISTGPIAHKRRFIDESFTTARRVTGAYIDDRIVGYVIWDRAFFGRPFVWLLGVEPTLRRRGIAARLMREVEAGCHGEPLFTSTNESNQAMHALLKRVGFIRSGYVENLDPGDPEIFYFKAAVVINDG